MLILPKGESMSYTGDYIQELEAENESNGSWVSMNKTDFIAGFKRWSNKYGIWTGSERVEGAWKDYQAIEDKTHLLRPCLATYHVLYFRAKWDAESRCPF
jgi:hypothetical protein